VSIEMPEAAILARQMQAELVGKSVAGLALRDCENLQRIGFVNRDPDDFGRLVGKDVESVVSRGNTIVVKLTGRENLILSPEYGGEIFYHKNDGSLLGDRSLPAGRPVPARYHLRLDFSDGSALTVRITSMGGIYASCDEGLPQHYMYRRDFDPEAPEPTDVRLSPEAFAEVMRGASRQLKSVLVGKDAVVVGLSNSAFQDIIYRARLHPKRKASDLSPEESAALYEALRFVMAERLRLGGKDRFCDLYGRQGGYVPAMGPGMKGRPCPLCGSPIQKLSLGGGDVFVCLACQKEPG
jgi:formamidopyrimidine-DNA glycosylase